MWKEFFKDDAQLGSMTRLILFGAFIIASIVMLKLTWDGKMSEGYLTIYTTVFCGTFAWGKKKDSDVTVAATHSQTAIATAQATGQNPPIQ